MLKTTAAVSGLCVLAAGLGWMPLASAQDHSEREYPTREITVVVGYAAGSGADLYVRFMAEELRRRAGKPVIVENKPGALTNIAALRVIHAKADGYTVLITSGSSFAINSAIFKELPFDPVNDFTPVTSLTTTPFVFLVPKTSEINSIADLTKALRAKDGKGKFAYPNSLSLIASELYKKVAGVDAVGIPYKSIPDAHGGLSGGEVDFFIGDLVIQGGKRLALTTRDRSAAAPGIPSALEQGLEGYDLFSWFAVWLPKGASPDVTAKLAGWFRQSLADPTAQTTLLERFGGIPWPGIEGENLKAFMHAEIGKWKALAAMAKVPTL